MAAIEPETLGQLFREHAPALVLYARQWCPNPEDVVQEAFIRLARQRTLPDRAIAWLHRVVRNGAIDGARMASRRREHEARAASGETWFATSTVDERIDAQRATQALADLPPEAREVIVARLWGGLNFEEVARLVGSSLTTVHRRYHDGLARLKERLDGRWTTSPRSLNAT
jgi:RNA polymerase sigma-70 factor (ECF subfamily)